MKIKDPSGINTWALVYNGVWNPIVESREGVYILQGFYDL